MAEGNRDLQLESRILPLNSRRILFEGKHRWLRSDEICEVLRNPKGVEISEEPPVMPPSGSIFLFDKKVQKHFRNDGYNWKKAKDGRTKEGHEKLKVEGLDTLHCYYAHGKEDEDFQRRSYWMLEENLSHMVLVHYRDVKGEKRKARYNEETETAEAVQHSRETDKITPNYEMDIFASSGFNPKEGKSKATPLATTEEVDKEKDEEEEGNDINQVRKRLKVTCGQKSNRVALSSDNEEATLVQRGLIVPLAVGTSPSQVQEFNSAIQQGEVIAGNNPATSDVAVTIDTTCATNDATALSQNATQIPSLTTVIVSNRGLNNQQADQSQPSAPQPTATIGSAISATTNKTPAPESSNLALVQSRPTSDTNQDFIQGFEIQEKETGPTSFVPENGKGNIVVQRDVGTEKFQIQDSPSIIQAQERDAAAILATFSIKDLSGAASLAIGPIHLKPNTFANVVDQAQDLQPPVLQPTATTGVVISATTNATAASESSNLALVQSEPTTIAKEDFTKDVAESQEKETEPTSVEPENGKSKAVVQSDFGTGKSHKFSEVVVMSSHKRLHELLDRASAPNTLARSSSTPTIDLQAIATTRATLEMDFITMADKVERTHMISCIQSLIDSNCFPTGTRSMTLAMLKQLEQSVPAYSEAYSEYDMGKNLTDQVEATKQLLQPRLQFCDSKNREILELEEKKMKIEARQAAIQAEIDGAIKETEPIQARLKKLLQRQDHFKKNEGNLKNILDIGDGLWTTLKSIIRRHLPT